MVRFLAVLFLLFPSVAKNQVLSKELLIAEWADIATLVGAESLGCDETNKERVLAFNKVINEYMLVQNPDLTIGDVEAAKLMTVILQYAYVSDAMEDGGCEAINKVIHSFENSMRFADSVYDYYTPLVSL